MRFSRREEVSWRDGKRDEGEAPGPMKPMPPAAEMDTARAGPAMTFMGAPTIRGEVAQG